MSKITVANFNKMTDQEKTLLVSKVSSLYLGENLPQREVKRKLNLSDNLILEIVKRYGLTKSKKDVAKSSFMSYQEKTGFSHPMKNPEVKHAVQKTTIDNYGAVGFSSSVLSEKSKNTCKERYGVDNYAKCFEFSEKFKKTSLLKYGVNNPAKSEAVKNKSKQTQLRRYGGKLFCQTAEFSDKFKKTSQLNYGVDNPAKAEIIKAKIQETNLSRYGNSYYFLTDRFKDQLKSVLDQRGLTSFSSIHIPDSVLEIIHSPENMAKYIMSKPSADRFKAEIARSLDLNEAYVGELICKYNLEHLVHAGTKRSLEESEIANFLDNNQVTYQTNVRNVIPPKEIDIFVPQYNLGIEYNGNYWHCSSRIDENYHQNKSLEAAATGIKLYHIFEYNWKNPVKQQIIKSQLLHLLGKTPKRIYARKCTISEISVEDARRFLDVNHLQGYRSSSIRLGLYYDGELVMVLTLGKSYLNRSDNLEIYRMATKNNTAVIGGASKLINYAVTAFNINSLFTYADISTGSGSVYHKLGFTYLGITSPNYVWVRGDKVLTRYQCMEVKDENKVMAEQGFSKIFDSGSLKFQLNLN